MPWRARELCQRSGQAGALGLAEARQIGRAAGELFGECVLREPRRQEREQSCDALRQARQRRPQLAVEVVSGRTRIHRWACERRALHRATRLEQRAEEQLQRG